MRPPDPGTRPVFEEPVAERSPKFNQDRRPNGEFPRMCRDAAFARAVSKGFSLFKYCIKRTSGWTVRDRGE